MSFGSISLGSIIGFIAGISLFVIAVLMDDPKNPFVFLDHGVKIGDKCTIKSGVRIGSGVQIGDHTTIRENSVIGGQGFGVERSENNQTMKIPHIGGVQIGSYVEIGAINTVVTGTIKPTIIGDYVKTDDHVHIAHNCKIGKGTLITACAELSGSVTIGKNAEIMECCIVRGPFAMGEGTVLKMGAKIYSNTTLGPFCKVGGEVNNVVFQGFSSKAHDGFLGNSVIGEWCNLGADSNNSNLKNNYAEVKLWGYASGRFQNTGLQFCGLIMGDHSKCGINTMFNTGTVVGVSANIFGAGFPRNFIPSFSWGGSAGFSTYKTEKAFEVAEIVMQRRNKSFDEQEENILSHIFKLTKTYRKA